MHYETLGITWFYVSFSLEVKFWPRLASKLKIWSQLHLDMFGRDLGLVVEVNILAWVNARTSRSRTFYEAESKVEANVWP